MAQNEKLLAANKEKRRHEMKRIISIDFWGTS